MMQQPYSGKGRLIVEVLSSTEFRHTTLGRTPLDKGSACCRDLYLTTPNIHKRQTRMPLRDSNPQSKQANGCRLMP